MYESVDPYNLGNHSLDQESERQSAEESTAPAPETTGSLLVRLSHIESYDYTASERLPVHMLAVRIGTNRQRVYRMLRDYGIEPEAGEYQGQAITCYPSFTLPLLLDEYQWREELRSLPLLLSITELAEHIGRSWGWTNNALNELDARPAASEIRSSKLSKLYNKNILRKLRKITMAFPMEDGWCNMHQLELISGEDREWIARRLSELGVAVEIRRSALTGKLYEHYPPEAKGLIKNARLARPEKATSGWLTAEAIPDVIGRSYNWCKTRLSSYVSLAELRLDSQGVSRVHYPPSVINALKAEKESTEAYPEADDDMLTFSSVAAEVGKSKTWVRKQMSILGIEGEVRRDKKGRLREHYPRRVVQEILKESDELLG